MEPLIISMDVTPSGFHLGLCLMLNAIKYCDTISINGKVIELEKVKEEDKDYKYKKDIIYHIEYQLKEGIDYIPEKAFSHAEIKSINIPEGIKTLKKECFRGCYFECDLILPASLEIIDNDVFGEHLYRRAEVTGEFHLPDGIKKINSLPKSQWHKNEIILPEGLIRYYPEYIGTDHLYISSSVKECGARFSDPDYVLKKVTISPDNKYLTVRDGELMRISDLNKGSYRYTEVTEQ